MRTSRRGLGNEFATEDKCGHRDAAYVDKKFTPLLR